MKKIKEDFEKYFKKRKAQKEEGSSSKNQSTVVTVSEPRKILNTTPLVIQFPIPEKDEVQASIVSIVQPQPGVSNVTIQLPRPFVYKDDYQVP